MARDIPNFAEYNVREIYEEALMIPAMAAYLPEKSGSELPSKQWLFTIINTVDR